MYYLTEKMSSIFLKTNAIAFALKLISVKIDERLAKLTT